MTLKARLSVPMNTALKTRPGRQLKAKPMLQQRAQLNTRSRPSIPCVEGTSAITTGAGDARLS